MLCPKCQRPNQDQAKFCFYCGQAMAVVAPTRLEVGPQRCVHCGKELRAGAKFCGACGTHQPAAVETVRATVASGGSVQPLPPPASSSQPSVMPASLPPAVQAASRLSRGYVLRHTFLAGLLAVSLLFALAAAFRYAPPITTADDPTDAPPVIPTPVLPTPQPTPTADYRQAVVAVASRADGRFGLITVQGDPDNPADDNKPLTFDVAGGTNDTRVWIEGAPLAYGEGGFQQSPQENNGQTSALWIRDAVAVTQTLVYVYGTNTGRVDTVQIKYTLTNQASMTKTVGLRLMLDTLIGDNDGVPFVVPGREGIVDRAVDLRGDAVPDFVQALEFPNLAEPGVIVHLTLQGTDATRPDRLVISAWCEGNGTWDYYPALGGDGHTLTRCGLANDSPDSAIGLYFDPQPLGPGASRTLITYYGLGGISSTESGNATLSLLFNRQVNQGDEFWITALVGMPQAGQRVRLELPDGLVLSDGMAAEQPVTAGGDFTQLSWRVQAEKAMTDAPVTVVLTPAGVSESQSITVQSISIFEGQR